MSIFNQRGIFLQKLGPTSVNPHEVRVSMQFALKEEGWDVENSLPTQTLLDSSTVTAVSSDGGRTFRIGNVNNDVNGDGNINAGDKAELIALAKAYANIETP
ncbi:hypothetical protein [Pseudomonas sp. NPDC089569]|uniref:hypothetical protein n=1 Tax=Pseudomonas sp. NPDC089569 TaxID=3390722 RepID=UPI003D01838E